MLRKLLSRTKSDERGSALVNVVAVVAISAVVVLAVSSSVFAAGGVTTMTRAGVQSKAAAEAGIDWALGELNRGYFLCAADKRTEDPGFAVTITYTTTAGAPLACGITVGGSPGHANIISTGYALQGGTTSSIGNTAQMAANADITLATSGAVLDRALFSESGFTLTNTALVAGSAPGVLDGDVYTNGSLTCETGNRIEGTVIARGDVTVTNTCAAMESVWAGGNVDLTASGVKLAGDVFAGGWAKINVGHVQGNVVANGDVTLTNQNGSTCGSFNANVCGSVYSLNGKIELGNAGVVGGSLYARNNVSMTINSSNPAVQNITSLNGALTMQGAKASQLVKVYGAISSGNAASNIVKANTCSVTVASTYWTACTPAGLALPMVTGSIATFTPTGSADLGTRTSVVAVAKPTRQSFPQLFSSTAAIAANWADWVKIAVPTSYCAYTNSGQMTTNLTTLLAPYGSGTKVLLMWNCSGQVPGNNLTLQLKGDLAMMSAKGFNFTNELKILSTAGPWAAMFIVPSDSPGVAWAQPDPVGSPGQLAPTCTGVSSLHMDKLVVSNATRIFLYTPCALDITNSSAVFDGQIYSGSASYQGINIRRAVMTVPGIEVPGSVVSVASTSAVITNRYDVG